MNGVGDDVGADASVLDIDGVLAPVAGDRPAGPDLAAEGSTDVSDLRARARSEETATTNARMSPLREPTADNEAGARWRSLCTDALQLLGRSKDLRVALVLVQGLTRSHGFAGLRDGLTLVDRLGEEYGDSLHPVNVEERRRVVGQYFGPGRPGLLRACDQAQVLSGAVKVGAYEGKSGDTIEMSLTRQLLRESSDAEYVRQQRRDGRLVASRDELTAWIRSGPAAKAVAAGRSVLEAVQERLDGWRSRLGESGVAIQTPEISSCIAELLTFLGPPARPASPGGGIDTPASVERGPSLVGVLSAGDTAGSNPPAHASGDRNEMLASMLRLAAWFESREPQGTVHYDLRRAVRRANLSLDKVIEELASDAGSKIDDAMRRRLLWNLGLDPATIVPPETSSPKEGEA